MRSIRAIFAAATLISALTVAACGSDQTSSPAPTTTIARSIPTDEQLKSIRGDLVIQGYSPISMTVDDRVNPSVITTLWSSVSANTLVEVKSSDGVTAISFRFPNPSGPTALVVYRCAMATGIRDVAPFNTALNDLSGKTIDQLKHAACQTVTGD